MIALLSFAWPWLLFFGIIISVTVPLCSDCPCEQTCFGTYTDTISIILASIAPCGCFVLSGVGATKYQVISFTGINGAFDLVNATPIDPNAAWGALIGTVTLQATAGATVPPSATCDIPLDPVPAPYTVDVFFSLQCAHPGNPSDPVPIGDYGLFGGATIEVEAGSPPLGAIVFSTGFIAHVFAPSTTANFIPQPCDLNGAGQYYDQEAFGGGTLQIL